MGAGNKGKRLLPIWWPEAREQTITVRRGSEVNRLEQPIVCVADDKNEVAPLRHVLRVAGISNRFYIVTNGQQAIAYLASAARLRNGETNRFPCLVLLA